MTTAMLVQAALELVVKPEDRGQGTWVGEPCCLHDNIIEFLASARLQKPFQGGHEVVAYGAADAAIVQLKELVEELSIGILGDQAFDA